MDDTTMKAILALVDEQGYASIFDIMMIQEAVASIRLESGNDNA